MAVIVVHRDHDDGAGRNKLGARRQALSEQAAAREHAERLLHEALATIQDLQTKLAHERIAKGEAFRRSEDERQAIRDELVVERAARHQVEQERDQVGCSPPGSRGRKRPLAEGRRLWRLPRHWERP